MRDLVKKMEADTGQKLDWCAIEHKNTAHGHVHLLVRGTAQDGQPTQLSQHYLRTELQAYSQELATDALGWRSAREAQAGRMKLATTLNKTSLDTELNRITARRSRHVDLSRAADDTLTGAVPPPLRHLSQSEMEKTYGKETYLDAVTVATRTQESDLLERRYSEIGRYASSQTLPQMRDLPEVQLDGDRSGFSGILPGGRGSEVRDGTGPALQPSAFGSG